MSAIFGFTFHIGRMTEVLTPDIYIESSLAHSGPVNKHSQQNLIFTIKNLQAGVVNSHQLSPRLTRPAHES